MSTPVTTIPQHVAIIMDGNGRWAKEQNQQRIYGHQYGVQSVRSVVQTAAKIGVRYLTVYAFSTENWGRPEDEVQGIMELVSTTILSQTSDLQSNRVRLKFIGNLTELSTELQQSIAWAENVEIQEPIMTLVVALNYSARWEITRAMKQIAESGIPATEITQETISNHLTTASIPDPELLIRTSGEVRLSNFLLWQLSYTELYFTSTLWPDFSGEQFMEAIEEYNRRQRRFGLTE